jgi:hypothetical protein
LKVQLLINDYGGAGTTNQPQPRALALTSKWTRVGSTALPGCIVT